MSVRYIRVKDHEGQRLDNFLIRELKPVPRSRIMQMIRRGEVRVNGKRAKVSLRLTLNDRIRVPPVSIESPPESDIPGWLLSLIEESVVFEDNKLIVINKPPGIAVHAGGSIQVGLIEAVRKLFENDRIDLAHRIDRDTSGCVLLTKTRVAMLEVHHAFQQKRVDKNYSAIVHGRWPDDVSAVELPLKKFTLPGGERRVEVAQNGRDSLSNFSIKCRSKVATWMNIRPVTGRTHQIRVHAAYSNHPILGDRKYGTGLQSLKVQRLMLHAESIQIGDQPAIRVPNPPEFSKVWHQCCSAD